GGGRRSACSVVDRGSGGREHIRARIVIRRPCRRGNQSGSRPSNPRGGDPVSEAMDAEFDTVAEWTAQVAVELGTDYHIPAACRGSGSPRALDWLIDRMDLAAGQVLLDSGAGVGGPAAYAAQQNSVRPFLVE